MDLVTPAIALPPGRAVAALNYEPIAAGYRRLSGYERFDGQAPPRQARAWLVTYDGDRGDGWTNPVRKFLPGQIVRTRDLHTIGFVAAEATLVSGSWDTYDAVAQVLFYVLEGQAALLIEDEWLRGGSLIKGYVRGEPLLCADPASQALAAAQARLRIFPVPGSGPVRGVWYHGDKVLAVRDNEEGTEGLLYESNEFGWGQIVYGRQLDFFSGGTFEISSGTTLRGSVSGATATVREVAVTSGSWESGDAAGHLQIYSQGGTFEAEDVDCFGGPSNIATIAGDSVAYTLPPGGHYEWLNHNFFGAADLSRIYGVNGVGQAFVYDPAILTLNPIVTGAPVDTPKHIAVHRQSLFLALPGGSLQFSQVGEPAGFDAALGAGEIGTGSEINALVSLPNALGILGSDSISVLYGNDSTDYQLEVLTREAGAFEHSAQKIGRLVYMDNRGLRGLEASQDYGNFSMGTISRLVAPLLEDYRRDGIRPTASFVCRTADQYWLFFDNGTGLVVHMGGKEPQILPVNLGRSVTCAASVEVDGEERLFFGSDDGYVYELNRGTSFDGEPIEHYLRLPFNHFGSPRQRKRLHQVVIDLEAAGPATLSVSADLDYGAAPGIGTQQLVVTTGGGAIDSLGSNELYFASQIETTAEAWLDGVARNVSLKIGGLTAGEQPHILTGITFHVSPRGLQR